MKGMRVMALVIAAAMAGEAAAQSHEKLTGRRLKRFEKSGGASELGRYVSLELPAKIFADEDFAKPAGLRNHVGFVHRGVEYVVKRTDPSLRQTVRKAKKDPGGKVLMKGRVVEVPGRTKRAVVRIASLQKFGKRGKKGARSGWSGPPRIATSALETP